jgi:hypothetical protein
MINKRLLIKNLISQHDENTFFDKKSQINIDEVPSKAKLLKHICALSNSNPKNDSYIIFGISDDSDELLGVNFIDDSKIQNLVKSYLNNAPIINYENISFPDLSNKKSIGLLSIASSDLTTSFAKNIWKINKENAYYRYGSNSILIDSNFYVDQRNVDLINSIHLNSKNNLKETLDNVEKFKSVWGNNYNPTYLVFKDLFVLCWSGYKDNYGDQSYYTEVDVQIINEGKRLFFSAIEFINIKYDDNNFIILESIPLGFDDNFSLHQFNKTTISFFENGRYSIKKENIFNPPIFPKELITNLYLRAKKCELNFKENKIDSDNYGFAEGLANYYLICYLNGIESAKDDLINSIQYLDGTAAGWQIDCMKILNEIENK